MELLFPLLILLLFIPIFLSGRKQRRQMQEMQKMQAALEVGDVVTTTSGVRGTIVDASYEDTIDLDIASDPPRHSSPRGSGARSATRSRPRPLTRIRPRTPHRTTCPTTPPASLPRTTQPRAPPRPWRSRRWRSRRWTSRRWRRTRRRTAQPAADDARATAGTDGSHLTGRDREQWHTPRGTSVPGVTWRPSSPSSPRCMRWCSSPATAAPRPSWVSTCRAAPASPCSPAPRPAPSRRTSSSCRRSRSSRSASTASA